VIKMEIWGELSLPSDPFALTDSNMFESIDDSEHDQYEDEFEADGHNHEVNSYVCDAAKALESVLSEALGKYPLIFLDDQTKTLESMQNYSTNSRTQGTRTKSKIKRTISASLFGDCLDSCDETSDLLEIWEEDELDDEISSIEEEIARIQQQKYVKETSIPYSPRSESPCSTLFFEEYSDFLQEPEEIPDSSSDSSPLNSPLPSPPQSFPPPPTPINDDDSSDTAHASGSSCDENESSLSAAISIPASLSSPSPSPASLMDDSKTEDQTSKKRTAETEKPNTREKRRRNTKNCVSKSNAAASLSVAVSENSSESPSKPTRRKKSKKRTTPKKKKMEAIFKSEEVLKIKRMGDDEVDVNVDIGDASDFTNY